VDSETEETQNTVALSSGVSMNMDTGDLVVDPAFNALRNQQAEPIQALMASQHPLDALLYQVHMDLGGHQFLLEYAHSYPGKFYDKVFASRPSMQPSSGMQGDITITIHNDLGRSPLDDSEPVAEQ
tara:strand:+ start:95 stop:472 length:378 start_codon:yes stop_codon:yes gene_type:complete